MCVYIIYLFCRARLRPTNGAYESIIAFVVVMPPCTVYTNRYVHIAFRTMLDDAGTRHFLYLSHLENTTEKRPNAECGDSAWTKGFSYNCFCGFTRTGQLTFTIAHIPSLDGVVQRQFLRIYIYKQFRWMGYFALYRIRFGLAHSMYPQLVFTVLFANAAKSLFFYIFARQLVVNGVFRRL